MARERSRADAAERRASEQTVRANREEQRANEAEKRLSRFEQFLRQSGVSEAFDKWNRLFPLVENAAKSLVAWAHSRKSIFTSNDEKVIGQGIIAKCQLDGLNPFSDCDRQEAANGIVAEADKVVGDISKYSWETAVRRIGQLASEMGRSMGGQYIGGSNGNADELTNWDGTKKRGLGI